MAGPNSDLELSEINGKVSDPPRTPKELDAKKEWFQWWHEYPKYVFCIIGNEFCERFCFTGITTVYIFYMVNIMNYPQITASSILHTYATVVAFTPIFGSILADGFIGKYHTIMWLSVIYACGCVVMAVAAGYKPGSYIHPWLDFIGLFTVGLGTGGIKPCVSVFGGEQFESTQVKFVDSYFSVFYFTINVGNFLAGFLTPYLRVQECFGADTCYSLAFSVPAVLMICAVVFFAIGTPFYKRIPPKGNLIIEFFKVITVADINWIKSNQKRTNFLDYYLDTHDCAKDKWCRDLGHCHKVVFIKDVRAVLRILAMYLPLPFFWMVYSQAGDRWELQAATMNGRFGSFTFLPDEIGTVNAVLVLMFIPLFQGIIYPLVSKIYKLTCLRKMGIGGYFWVASFIVSGLLQLQINTTLPDIPAEGSAYFTVLNYANCPVNVTSQNNSLIRFQAVENNSEKLTVESINGQDELYSWLIVGECISEEKTIITTNLSSSAMTYAVVTDNEFGSDYASLQKSTQGDGQFKININYFANNPDVLIEKNVVMFAWCTSNVDTTSQDAKTCNLNNAHEYSETTGPLFGGSDFVELLPNRWHLFIMYIDNAYHNTNVTFYNDKQGGIYSLTLLNNATSKSFMSGIYQIAPDNTINIFWQMPQIILITVGEVLFEIAGLEFSFTQAPKSMKSLIMAAWLITTAVGNLIVAIVFSIDFISNLAYLYFFFALILFVIMAVFVGLAVFYYEYVEIER